MRALGSAYQRTIYHNELPSFLRPAFRPLPSHALTFPPFSPRSRLINKPVIALWSYWERALPIALAKVTGVKPISCRGNPGYSSGIFLAAYVLGHMNSVFVFARLYLGVDSDWAFATGAPSGLIKDAWNIRLVPHYGLGVFFVLSHLAAGARVLMLSHGVARRYADRFL